MRVWRDGFLLIALDRFCTCHADLNHPASQLIGTHLVKDLIGNMQSALRPNGSTCPLATRPKVLRPPSIYR